MTVGGARDIKNGDILFVRLPAELWSGLLVSESAEFEPTTTTMSRQLEMKTMNFLLGTIAALRHAKDPKSEVPNLSEANLGWFGGSF